MHIEAKTLFEFNCIWRSYDAYVKPQNDRLQKHTHIQSHVRPVIYQKCTKSWVHFNVVFIFHVTLFFPTRKLVQNYVMTKICLPFQLCTCLRAGFMVSDEIKAILIKWTHFKLIEAKKSAHQNLTCSNNTVQYWHDIISWWLLSYMNACHITGYQMPMCCLSARKNKCTVLD